jgi:hypothetical protein
MLLGLNGLPRSFTKPWAANSAEIARRLSLRPWASCARAPSFWDASAWLLPRLSRGSSQRGRSGAKGHPRERPAVCTYIPTCPSGRFAGARGLGELGFEKVGNGEVAPLQ